MDAYRAPAAAGERAVRFTGSWREYLPIAVTNALLFICTLGIYRFWAAARQRRYLWSRTEFIDDTLEWTGTGKEMFLGFLIVIAVLAPFFLFIQFLFPALVARGKTDAAFGVIFLFEIAIVYLGGFARFRALRYRLSQELLARHPRRQQRSRVELWRRISRPHRPVVHEPCSSSIRGRRRGSGTHAGTR